MELVSIIALTLFNFYTFIQLAQAKMWKAFFSVILAEVCLAIFMVS
jgi:hypothetical protein